MTEKCPYAYRVPVINALMCKCIKGDAPYCGHQYLCRNTQRWEANPNVRCTFREQARNGEIQVD